ncbi:WhiB family transcriptional regulator [Streptomyces caniscabiei]|uniref:WhiB family transcriptional regulator n=1 Tax=Streptomyces caniscabiei TaxID=2746961 RepID=A0ABU4MZP9_9ACTN|nr:WhiB family transcriptional regulator [Streptomyces caniscabiei]MBE4790292.1 WhiB family transcriptional regulator [Streptomyces caniscabiei]MBE4799479.1 WhiB family transcriptional regulator [Streptomyces caniscabiei]MDX3015149.1 WhiB family transcriptional regulator [Streptomyces caniscabiei]MDX3042592.1 WhiB family transcriptional regulator [Streptomyces caniscabiei]
MNTTTARHAGRRARTHAAPTVITSRRPEPVTASWENRAACYNRPEGWWDGEDPELTAKARAVCLSCPVLAECLGDRMRQERSVIWSRATVRAGLTGAERVQLFLDEREHGPYDAEEARLLALEAVAEGRSVSQVVDDAEAGVSTVRLAQRLAGEDVPVVKPPSAVELRGGTAKERAYSMAQEIMEWHASGMTNTAIAARLGTGRRTIQDLIRSFSDLAAAGPDEGGQTDPVVAGAGLLEQFLAEGYDTDLTADQQVAAIVMAVGRGMSYPQVDEARRLVKGYTASFMSRQRKRYARQGREFPLQPGAHRGLTAEQVLRMRERYAKGGVTDLELSLQYGVPRNVVSHALSGRNYRDVGGPIRAGRSEESLAASREQMCGHAANSRAAMTQSEMGEVA